MKNIWLLILVASTFVRQDNSQRVIYPEDEEEFCSEKTGQDAHCVRITECPSAKDSIRDGKGPVTCGFSGEIPLVCCLFSAVTTEPRVTTDLLCGKNAYTRDNDGVLYRNDSYTQVNESEGLEINTDGRFIIQPRILRRERFRVASQDWPWMVAIYMKSNGSFVCNSFVVDSSHLLTTAHCFQGKRRQPQDYYVGTIHNDGKMSAEVTEMRIHPSYKGNYYNDVALLKISPRLTNISPLCMPSGVSGTNYLPGTETLVLDWVGKEYVMQKTQIAETRLCEQHYTNLSNTPFPEGITNELMCAVPREKSDNDCQVHSGGPVMVEVGGQWMAVGIASFGIPCTLPTYPAVYTRIDSYLDWIRDNE